MNKEKLDISTGYLKAAEVSYWRTVLYRVIKRDQVIQIVTLESSKNRFNKATCCRISNNSLFPVKDVNFRTLVHSYT